MHRNLRRTGLLLSVASLVGIYISALNPAAVAPKPDLVLLPFMPTEARVLSAIEGQILVYSPGEDVLLERLEVKADGITLFEESLGTQLAGDPEYGEINALIERLPHEFTEQHRDRRYFATNNEAEFGYSEVIGQLREISKRVNVMRNEWERGAAGPLVQPNFRLELGEMFEPDAIGTVAEVEFVVHYSNASGVQQKQSITRDLTYISSWGSAAGSLALALGSPVTIHPGDLHVHSCHGEAAGACAPSANCTAETLQLSGSFSYAQLKSQYQALGMEWYTATDHSYCVNSDGEFSVIQSELAAITDASFLALPDLEVSSDEVGPQTGGDAGDALCLGLTSANHMGAHDLMHRIMGGEDGFAGFCDGLFTDVLDDFHTTVADVRSQGGYPVIHHPASGNFGWNSFSDTQGQEANALHGVEIWNDAFQSGQGGNVASWVDWMLGGRILYAYSGSDTHDEAFAFGANHALLIDRPLTEDNLHDALRAGQSYISNGPSLILEAELGGQTLLMGAQHGLPTSPVAASVTLNVHYDFGIETGTITLFEGKVGDAAESVLCQSGPLTGAGVFDCADVLTTSARSWYRAYAENDTVSQAAYTNPVYFEPGGSPLLRSFCAGDGGDGMGCTDCACGNNAPQGSAGGCLNASGTSAELLMTGSPSVVADSLRVEISGATPSNFAILISGEDRLPNNPTNPCFYLGSGVLSVSLDGLRCAGGDFKRHGVRPSDSSGDVGVTTAGWGGPDGPPGGLIAQGGFIVGQTRHYQSIYRVNGTLGCNTGLNTTQGVSVTFAP